MSVPRIKPRRFAKLFETEQFGQVLFILQQSDAGAPEVRTYMDPGIDGLSVSSFSSEFLDSPAGWEDAAKAFEEIGQEGARRTAEAFQQTMTDIFSGES